MAGSAGVGRDNSEKITVSFSLRCLDYCLGQWLRLSIGEASSRGNPRRETASAPRCITPSPKEPFYDPLPKKSSLGDRKYGPVGPKKYECGKRDEEGRKCTTQHQCDRCSDKFQNDLEKYERKNEEVEEQNAEKKREWQEEVRNTRFTWTREVTENQECQISYTVTALDLRPRVRERDNDKFGQRIYTFPSNVEHIASRRYDTQSLTTTGNWLDAPSFDRLPARRREVDPRTLTETGKKVATEIKVDLNGSSVVPIVLEKGPGEEEGDKPPQTKEIFGRIDSVDGSKGEVTILLNGGCQLKQDDELGVRNSEGQQIGKVRVRIADPTMAKATIFDGAAADMKVGMDIAKLLPPPVVGIVGLTDEANQTVTLKLNMEVEKGWVLVAVDENGQELAILTVTQSGQQTADCSCSDVNALKGKTGIKAILRQKQ